MFVLNNGEWVMNALEGGSVGSRRPSRRQSSVRLQPLDNDIQYAGYVSDLEITHMPRISETNITIIPHPHNSRPQSNPSLTVPPPPPLSFFFLPFFLSPFPLYIITLSFSHFLRVPTSFYVLSLAQNNKHYPLEIKI